MEDSYWLLALNYKISVIDIGLFLGIGIGFISFDAVKLGAWDMVGCYRWVCW